MEENKVDAQNCSPGEQKIKRGARWCGVFFLVLGFFIMYCIIEDVLKTILISFSVILLSIGFIFITGKTYKEYAKECGYKAAIFSIVLYGLFQDRKKEE